MAKEREKGVPGGVPPVPEELADTVRRAATDDAARHELRISLDVEGGHADDRYEFHFETSGTGDAQSSLRCNLTGRDHEPGSGKLASRELGTLVRSIDVAALQEAATSRPRIPPDSVVGRLRVSDGRQEVSTVFMADPEQAKDAGYEIPPGLMNVVERIYDMAAKQLGAKDVRP